MAQDTGHGVDHNESDGVVSDVNHDESHYLNNDPSHDHILFETGANNDDNHHSIHRRFPRSTYSANMEWMIISTVGTDTLGMISTIRLRKLLGQYA